MLFDYHSHTTRCGHARGEMEAYVEQALAMGLSEFGFSDHSPWMIQHPGEWIAMGWDEVPEYVADVRRLAERYDRDGERPFRLRLGFEMDYVPSRLGVAREMADRYPWDYLLGSIHHLGLWPFNNHHHIEHYQHFRMEDICEVYYELVERMVRERFCDIIAHLDLPKKYGFRPPCSMLRWIEPLIPEIRRSGMAVEINTSGRDHLIGEIYPDWDVIEALAAADVPLLLSSDAHAPEHVGRYFGEIAARLRACGVTHLVRYERRVPIRVPI